MTSGKILNSGMVLRHHGPNSSKFDEKWILRFLNLAKNIASWSKDPSTKVGAVIIRPDRTICSIGYNGFPRGVYDDSTILNDRPKKLLRVVHAELNAILNSREPTIGYSIFSTHYPCPACASTIIQAGIVEVYSFYQPDFHKRYKNLFEHSKDMFDQAKVSRFLIEEK